MITQLLRKRLIAATDATEVSDKQIVSFFTSNPSPTDDQIHQLAADHKLTPDQLEDSIYRLFGKALSELRGQEASITVTAALELAADDTVPMRTVLLRAGGVGELRKLPANKALTVIRKAAGELSKERKSAGKTYQIDKDQLTKWIDDNCTSPKGKAKPAEKPAAKPAAKKADPKAEQSDDPFADIENQPSGAGRQTVATKKNLSKLVAASPEDKAELAELYATVRKTKGPKQSVALKAFKAKLGEITGANLNSEAGMDLLSIVGEHLRKAPAPAAAKPQGATKAKKDKPEVDPADTPPAAKADDKVKELPPNTKFADGKDHSKRVSRDAKGNLSVGNTKLIPKGDGFTLHWKDGKDEEKLEVKSAEDVQKIGTNLKKDWAEWVKQHKAGDVTAQELKQVKEGYEEYVALLSKAKEHFTTQPQGLAKEVQQAPAKPSSKNASKELTDLIAKARASTSQAVKGLLDKLTELVKKPVTNSGVQERLDLLGQLRKELDTGSAPAKPHALTNKRQDPKEDAVMKSFATDESAAPIAKLFDKSHITPRANPESYSMGTHVLTPQEAKEFADWVVSSGAKRDPSGGIVLPSGGRIIVSGKAGKFRLSYNSPALEKDIDAARTPSAPAPDAGNHVDDDVTRQVKDQIGELQKQKVATNGHQRRQRIQEQIDKLSKTLPAEDKPVGKSVTESESTKLDPQIQQSIDEHKQRRDQLDNDTSPEGKRLRDARDLLDSQHPTSPKARIKLSEQRQALVDKIDQHLSKSAK